MEKDIRCFYLMNGQVLFAEYVGIEDNTEDILVNRAVMVMMGQGNNQVIMSTAFPFTNMDDNIPLNWRVITTSSSLAWNKSMLAEYEKFWEALKRKILKESTGIEIVPAGAMPTTPGPDQKRPSLKVK